MSLRILRRCFSAPSKPSGIRRHFIEKFLPPSKDLVSDYATQDNTKDPEIYTTEPRQKIPTRSLWERIFRPADQGNYHSQLLLDFRSEEDVKKWRVITDEELGGSSEAKFELNTIELPFKEGDVDEQGNPIRRVKHTAVWSGILRRIPRPVPLSSPILAQRVFDTNLSPDVDGFCGIISPEFRPLLDVSQFSMVAVKAKTDGRDYILNVTPMGLGIFDVYQGRILQTKFEPPFRTFKIQWGGLAHTQRGYLVAFPKALDTSRIKNFGFRVSGEGPFRFELEFIQVRSANYDEAMAAMAAQQPVPRPVLDERYTPPPGADTAAATNTETEASTTASSSASSSSSSSSSATSDATKDELGNLNFDSLTYDDYETLAKREQRIHGPIRPDSKPITQDTAVHRPGPPVL